MLCSFRILYSWLAVVHYCVVSSIPTWKFSHQIIIKCHLINLWPEDLYNGRADGLLGNLLWGSNNEDDSYHNVIAERGKAEYTSTQLDHSRDGLSLCSPWQVSTWIRREICPEGLHDRHTWVSKTPIQACPVSFNTHYLRWRERELDLYSWWVWPGQPTLAFSTYPNVIVMGTQTCHLPIHKQHLQVLRLCQLLTYAT